MPTDKYSDHITRQQQSGLSIRAYCRKFNLTYHTFLYRKKHLQQCLATTPSAFTEVIPAEPPASVYANLVLGAAHIQIPLDATPHQWRAILMACAMDLPC